MKVGIVGGGFSGCMVAVHLLREAPAGTEIHLIERRPPLGRGIAYGTRYESHVLNVRAIGMSAFPDDPEHFVRWARSRPELFEKPVQPGDFVSRRVYGMYIHALVEQADAGKAKGVELVRWADDAVDLHLPEGEPHLELESGETIDAGRIVLAIGHFPPGHPAIEDRSFYSSERYVGDPWSKGHLDAVHRDDAVLMIGSGLTALDLALALQERGHRGSIHMLSRTGRLPQPHRTAEPYRDFLSGETLPTNAKALLVRIRKELGIAAGQGIDWRPVLDAIRPHSQRLWGGLSDRERHRFLKHVRSFWETHRHRMPPQVEQMAKELQARGRLHLHAGYLTGFAEQEAGVCVTYRTRAGKAEAGLQVQHVVNCTGPECDYRRMRHALVVSLLGQGVARPDSLALGLDTDEHGALLNSEGKASPILYTLGPLRKGTLWETTAVPEIRVQAKELGSLLARTL